MALPAVLAEVLRCPACGDEMSLGETTLRCRRCHERYRVVDRIPRMLYEGAPGFEAKLREVEGWPKLALEQGWYRPDDEIDLALPFLNRDLGWEDRSWGATAHSFSLMLERYVRPGMRVLEVGAGKCWGALHLVPRGCDYVASDIVVDPNIGLRRGEFYAERVGEFGRVQADAERLPFADGAFDLAYCVATLHHALDLPTMVRELARVVRPGGFVCALNEGTRAPFRSGENPEQAHEKELGINEHVHAMWAYVAAFARARLVPLRLEHAEGEADLARRRIAGRLLRLPGGRGLATLWAANAYAYSGISLYARKPRLWTS